MIEIDKLSHNGIEKLIACTKLFSKAKDGEVNDEIIVLAGKDENVDHTLSWITGQNYKVMNIESYNEYDLTNRDQNIVLTASNGIPFNIIKDTNKKFLIIDVGSKALLDSVAQRVNYEKFNIKNKTPYSTYTRKRNPLDLITKDTQTIIECLSIVLESTVSNIRVQKHSITFFRGLSDEQILQWKEGIFVDIDLLEKQRVLTYKLARVIYIMASLNDYPSDEEVYLFYHESLGVLKYNNVYKEFWEVSNVR